MSKLEKLATVGVAAFVGVFVMFVLVMGILLIAEWPARMACLRARARVLNRLADEKTLPVQKVIEVFGN